MELDVVMDGDPISASNHVSRYCPPSKVDHDPVTMKPIGISKDNFLRRSKNGTVERGVSVNWIEKHSKPTITEALASVRKRMESYPYKVSDEGAFGIAKIQSIIDAGEKLNTKLSVIEDHRSDDDSHALILGIGIEDYLLQQEIAFTMDHYSAKL